MMNQEISTSNGGGEVRKVETPELSDSDAKGRKILGDNVELIKNVRTRLSVSLGGCQITVRELFDLKENAVLKLDRAVDQPVDVLLDGKVVARGEIVAVDDNFGVRITQLLSE